MYSPSVGYSKLQHVTISSWNCEMHQRVYRDLTPFGSELNHVFNYVNLIFVAPQPLNSFLESPTHFFADASWSSSSSRNNICSLFLRTFRVIYGLSVVHSALLRRRSMGLEIGLQSLVCGFGFLRRWWVGFGTWIGFSVGRMGLIVIFFGLGGRDLFFIGWFKRGFMRLSSSPSRFCSSGKRAP